MSADTVIGRPCWGGLAHPDWYLAGGRMFVDPNGEISYWPSVTRNVALEGTPEGHWSYSLKQGLHVGPYAFYGSAAAFDEDTRLFVTPLEGVTGDPVTNWENQGSVVGSFEAGQAPALVDEAEGFAQPCLQFDGTNDRLDWSGIAEDFPQLGRLTSDWEIWAAVRPTILSGNRHVFGLLGVDCGLVLEIITDSPRITIFNNALGIYYQSTMGPISIDQTHVIRVRHHRTVSIAVSADGSASFPDTSTNGTLATALSGTWQLGNVQGHSGSPFQGQIGDFAFIRRLLTDDEASLKHAAFQRSLRKVGE
jgi:hypothetical protein